MFEGNLEITGKHGEYIRRLSESIDSKNSIFSAGYYAYRAASIIGFLYQRKSSKDSSPAKPFTIFSDQLRNVRDDIEFNYSLIMLLDKKHEPDFDKRLQKAFGGSEKKLSDEALFEQYSLGGIEVLYEKIIKDANKPEDYLQNLFHFVQEFNTRYNATVDSGNLIELCRNASLGKL